MVPSNQKRSIWHVTAFFLYMLTIGCFAQDYRFIHVDVQQGLSHNYVKCIYKDKTGFVWIGTESGLNRFDGYTATVFRNQPSDSSSLFDDNIDKLFDIPGGKMGVGTSTGLCTYDPATEKFSTDLRFLQHFSIAEPWRLTNVVHDTAGNYWFLLRDSGIIYYNEKTGKAIAIRHSDNDSTTIASNNITSLVVQSDDSYWIAHANGVIENIVWRGQRMAVIKRITALRANFPHKDRFHNCELMLDNDKDLWFYTTSTNLGAFYLDTDENKVYHLGKDSHPVQLSSDLISAIVQDNRGNIWLSHGNNGIDVLNKKDLSVKNLSHVPENDRTLSQNSVTTMIKDNEGVIWVGTFKRGLNFYHENTMRFPVYNRYSKLPFEDITCFAEDKYGNLWLGTNGGGLIYFDRQSKKFTVYKNDPENPSSLSSNFIVDLYLDHEDKLWVATYLGGLNSFDGKKFTKYLYDPSNAKSISDNSVWEIFEDSEEQLWIGTLNGGLNIFDRKTKTFKEYLNPDRIALRSTYVSTIIEDTEGNMWFGTSLGIDVLMRATKKIVHFEQDKNNPSTIPNNAITCALKDSKGRIWIGSRGGLSLWQRKSNTFTNFTEKDGLPHNVILSIVEDNTGRFWIGTPNGLSCATIDSKEESPRLDFKNYSDIDGLQGKQFNEDAALKTKSGELVFGGINGFNIFRPDNIGYNNNAPPVVFTDFKLFDQSVRPGYNKADKFTLTSAITTNPPIVLNASNNVFSIQFAALNFIQSAKNKYKYKLEGFNDHWLNVDTKDRIVTFTNLDPGEYIFHVIASNNDNIWNNTGASLHIKVLPPWWKSETAYIIYLTILFSILLLSRKLVQQRERLKFAIRQQHEETARALELDRMKTRFFTNVSHEFRTPLSLIISPLEKLREQAADPEHRKQLDLIQRNAKRLLNLVNQLLDFRKMEVHDIKFRPSEGDIIKFVRETVYSFSDLSEKKDIRLTFDSNISSLEAIFDHDKVEKILFNLLSNAFKFTMSNGNISVTVQVKDSDENNLVEIRVKDSGIGIPREKHELIFERFFQNDLPNSIMNQGSGIGLAITKEFVRIHGGNIYVESEVEKGSCFIVVLPLKKLVCGVHETVNAPVISTPADAVDSIEPSSQNKPVILLVEDSEDFRFYLKDNLKASYSIVEASTGDEGWEKTLLLYPDLIVSDIMMPGMNGLEFCKKIKSDQRISHIPVILLTARSGEEQRLEGFEVGADDYIPKPFSVQILESRIRNLISLRQELNTLFSKKGSIKASDIQITSLDEQFLRRFISTIEQNIDNSELSVIDISRELGIGRSQFFRKVQMLTGKSPLEVIRTIRLQHAAQLLEKSQLTVSEVAYKVGFNNPKYFTRYFKEVYHVLPSAYAKGKRGNQANGL